MQEIEHFIKRWSPSGGGERSNYQLFLSELCELLKVPKPDPAVTDDAKNAYVFDRSLKRTESDGSTTTNFIDLYKRDCFICQTKQGVERNENDSLLPWKSRQKLGHGVRGSGSWDTVMEKARNQAEQYARALPAAEGRPPFLLIIDVGYSIELFAEFTCTGGTYVRFPDPKAHRIFLAGLREERHRDTLRQIWTDPLSLDPARRSAKVTREIADHLAKLARSFEKEGHDAQIVAEFIMRCIFTMFAEDVRLLPDNSFKKLLESLKNNIRAFPTLVGALWKDMASGTEFSVAIREKVLHFNGGLFESATAFAVTADQLALLIEAAKADWRDVEPAIFGTLLERALSPRERRKLGAHYTPRAYVERLVFPTVIDPLRQEWETVKTAAAKLTADAEAAEDQAGQLDAQSAAIVKSGDAKAAKAHGEKRAKQLKDASALRKNAIQEVRRFHHALCKTRVLDPACGSGNFLYVTMEHMKRLEGEVLELLSELGDKNLEAELREFKVRPHQFIGLEINPWAVPIAELVLWIGYLQWHFRTSDKAVPDDPVISKEHSIRKQDAVLAYDRVEMVTEANGKPVTRWDGHTTKSHPVTSREVPDETARVPVFRYLNPRKAEWPEADYVVGNPPFIGKLHLLRDLGEGYVEAVRDCYESKVPGGSDFVMYWWFKAALLLSDSKVKRFGFISTKSISQSFNRQVVESFLRAKDPLHLSFAIPNHPWVDSGDGADVRIAMTVASKDSNPGLLSEVVSERSVGDGEIEVSLRSIAGLIRENLRIGPDISAAHRLAANGSICGTGFILGGRGFVITPEQAGELLVGEPEARRLVFPLFNGRDITDLPRRFFVIDAFGLSEADVLSKHPKVFQRLRDTVYPERQQNRDQRLRENWWLFRRSNEQVRAAVAGMSRFIVTVETAKHRVFTFLPANTRPEHKLVVFGSDDAYLVAVLSSRIHVCWALAVGGRLGVGNDPVYAKNSCFEKFPFPSPDEATRERIRALGEQLDAHRKRQQALHPGLTLTGMYNVLEKLRATGVRPSEAAAASNPSTASETPSASRTSNVAAPENGRTLAVSLTAKEKEIHELGLVSVHKQIHDDLDAAVCDAYGWPHNLSDEEILQRLVALNHERAAEEKRGHIRWLRPDFQCRDQQPQAVQTEIETDEDITPASLSTVPIAKSSWPKALADQVNAVSKALESSAQPLTASDIARQFQRASKDRIAEILETLVALGKARKTDDHRFHP